MPVSISRESFMWADIFCLQWNLFTLICRIHKKYQPQRYTRPWRVRWMKREGYAPTLTSGCRVTCAVDGHARQMHKMAAKYVWKHS